MTDIKVPIGRGVAQFVSEEFTKKSEQKATTDLQFLKEIADKGQMITASGSATATGDVTSIEVPAGSTLYLITSTYSWTATGAGNANASAINLIVGPDIIESKRINLSTNDSGAFLAPFARLIGNGQTGDDNNVRIRLVEGTGNVVAASGSLLGYFENSVRT